MNNELIERYITEDEDEEPVRHWFYKKGFNWLSIDEALRESVSEACFLDKDETLIQVNYGSSDDMELTAILTTEGEVVCKGILEVTEHVKNYNWFIVYFRGAYANDNLFYYYTLQEMEEYFMMVDMDGRVIIEPTDRRINYEDDEDAFFIGFNRGYVK